MLLSLGRKNYNSYLQLTSARFYPLADRDRFRANPSLIIYCLCIEIILIVTYSLLLLAVIHWLIGTGLGFNANFFSKSQGTQWLLQAAHQKECVWFNKPLGLKGLIIIIIIIIDYNQFSASNASTDLCWISHGSWISIPQFCKFNAQGVCK